MHGTALRTSDTPTCWRDTAQAEPACWPETPDMGTLFHESRGPARGVVRSMDTLEMVLEDGDTVERAGLSLTAHPVLLLPAQRLLCTK